MGGPSLLPLEQYRPCGRCLGANKKSYAQSDLTGFHHLRHRCEAETKSIPWNVDEAKPKAKHLPKELKSKARFYS